MTMDRMSFAFPTLTPAVRLLLILNTAVFVVNFILGGRLGAWCGISFAGMGDGYGLGVLRLITYQFVHSYHDPLHLLMNLLVLYFFGTMVEGTIGRRRFLWLYLLCGVAGGLLESALSVLLGSGHTTIGASGACYGVMVYAAFLAPHATVFLLVFPVKLWLLVSLLVGLGVYSLLLQLRGDLIGGHVAHGGHVGGALYGFLAFKARYSRFAPLDALRQWAERRRREQAARDQKLMDELLEKVHRQGIGSLTPAERRFLEKASRNLRR